MNGSERTDPLTYRCHLRANTLVVQHDKKVATFARVRRRVVMVNCCSLAPEAW
jgi:hypothetical protein